MDERKHCRDWIVKMYTRTAVIESKETYIKMENGPEMAHGDRIVRSTVENKNVY